MSDALRLAVAGAVLALLLAGSGGAIADSADRPTVGADAVTVTGGEAASTSVVLSRAPRGLSGYDVVVAVPDGDVAAIDGVEYGDQFALANDPEWDEDNASVHLSAVDLDQRVQAGATDVTLATLRLRGEAAGESRLTVRVVRMDDDQGEAVAPATDPGTVTVRAVDQSSEPDQSAPETAETPDFGVLPLAVAALFSLSALAAGALLVRRR